MYRDDRPLEAPYFKETPDRDKFWFNIFNERHPDEVAEILDSKEYKEYFDV